MICNLSSFAVPAVIWPFRLEYFSGWVALGLFVLLSLPVIWLGNRSLNGLGPIRKWVAIVLRLMVILLVILILGGIRLQRRAQDVEVMILRDISGSTTYVHDFPGTNLETSLDNYLNNVSRANKPPNDRVGLISFQSNAMIDALPGTTMTLDSRAIRDAGNGTDAASAIQLGLATLQENAMHRMLMIWDGNATQGELDPAISAAAASHVPIDVMPLHYDVHDAVMNDKFVAPTRKRVNEPFSLEIVERSTSSVPVNGKLTVLENGVPMELAPGQNSEEVTLQPGRNLFHVRVPAATSAGLLSFHASFEPDKPEGGAAAVSSNNTSADAFTFVQGKGQILYVDNVPDGRGEMLRTALNEEGVEVTTANHITPDQFPATQLELQNYDAIILANVPYGPGGLSEDQQRNLAGYVHDTGGGLVMIGGPDTFGAGGWQGRKLEEVLPVNMDIPAQRQIPKGALVLCMDSAEMRVNDGSYWSEQCAIKAMETLSSQDDIGIVTWNWNGGGSPNWDLPLGPKGDGSKAIAAVKKWSMGDLPDFNVTINLALDGDATSKGLLASDARQKHIIVITDDDPTMPNEETIQKCIKAKITVSTITVYPHTPHNVAPGVRELAKRTGGRSFGPIEDNPNQLPQIFVKEATVVRRSLIQEDNAGIPLKRTLSNSDMIKGLGDLPMVRGMVLTSRKNNPQIEMPLVAGKNNDPVLAHWQTGLGRAVVYTSDANNLWGLWWVGSPEYNKFWAQVVRGVARPPSSNLFDPQTSPDGDRGHVVIEALGKNGGYQDFLTIGGKVRGPDPTKPPIDIHPVQTGPGRYEAWFNAPDPGIYLAAMPYQSANGEKGILISGMAMNTSLEMRDLQSNDGVLKDIAERTGGRVLPAFDVAGADLFNRAGLSPEITPLPIWDSLVGVLIALILMDVAARRIAWDREALKRYAVTAAGTVRSFTTTRKIETRVSVDALKRIREEAAATAVPVVSANPAARPDPKARFEAKGGVEGDISKIVGGATDKPIPSAPRKIEPKGAVGGMGSLMAAKRRAQEQIKLKEKGD
jgi:uncharacterized membrane protein